jgi:hypothetical protein
LQKQFPTSTHRIGAEKGGVGQPEPEAAQLAHEVIVAPVHEDQLTGGNQASAALSQAIKRATEIVETVGTNDNIELFIGNRQVRGLSLDPPYISRNVFGLSLAEHFWAEIYSGDVQPWPSGQQSPFQFASPTGHVKDTFVAFQGKDGNNLGERNVDVVPPSLVVGWCKRIIGGFDSLIGFGPRKVIWLHRHLLILVARKSSFGPRQILRQSLVMVNTVGK